MSYYEYTYCALCSFKTKDVNKFAAHVRAKHKVRKSVVKEDQKQLRAIHRKNH